MTRSRCFDQPSTDLSLAIEQVQAAGEILLRDFQLPLTDLTFEEKDDRIRSIVGQTDVDASNLIVENIGLRTGEKTITEEYARALPHLQQYIAPYGEENAWCLDPLDGTKDFRDGMLANPGNEPENGKRVSPAMVSLAKIAGGQPRVGALLAPVLSGPARLYAGEENQGAFVEAANAKTPLQIDADQNEGVVLVSENPHPSIDRIASIPGLTPVRLGGLVFKMLCAVDPDLIQGYYPRLNRETRRILQTLPILGVASPSAGLHDYAATTVVCREAGAIVTAIDGNENVRTGPGEHGILLANSARLHNVLVDAMRE